MRLVSHMVNPASPASVQKQSGGGLYVLLLFLIFNDSSQTDYFNIYRTDHRQICRVRRIVAVIHRTGFISVAFSRFR